MNINYSKFQISHIIKVIQIYRKIKKQQFDQENMFLEIQFTKL